MWAQIDDTGFSNLDEFQDIDLACWSGNLSAIGCECFRNDYDGQPSYNY